MVTVRELARSQGFPDHFVFYAADGDVKTVGLLSVIDFCGIEKLFPLSSIDK